MAKQFNKMTKEDLTKCRIVTPVFRVAFPHLFQPYAMDEGSKKKFSVTMLFPKKSDLTDIKKALRNVKLITWGEKDEWPEDLESPVVDGDLPKHKDKQGYKGCYAIKATSNENQKPGVFDYPNCDPILDPADLYPGCYARASVLGYPWAFGSKQGVGFILDHVQKIKDGEPFTSKPSAESVFAPIDGLENDSEDNF
jgi:hypothetical protein